MSLSRQQVEFLQLLNTYGKLFGWSSNPTAVALARRGLIKIESEEQGDPRWAVFVPVERSV